MSRFSHVLLSSAAARVRGPSYRRGDEPSRVVSPARLSAVLDYCRSVDSATNSRSRSLRRQMLGALLA